MPKPGTKAGAPFWLIFEEGPKPASVTDDLAVVVLNSGSHGRVDGVEEYLKSLSELCIPSVTVLDECIENFREGLSVLLALIGILEKIPGVPRDAAIELGLDPLPQRCGSPLLDSLSKHSANIDLLGIDGAVLEVIASFAEKSCDTGALGAVHASALLPPRAMTEGVVVFGETSPLFLEVETLFLSRSLSAATFLSHRIPHLSVRLYRLFPCTPVMRKVVDLVLF